MKSVILLGCGGSAGINFSKSLRLVKEEFLIVGLDINKYYLELADVDKRYLLPQPAIEYKLLPEKLNELTKKHKIDFIHAQPDKDLTNNAQTQPLPESVLSDLRIHAEQLRELLERTPILGFAALTGQLLQLCQNLFTSEVRNLGELRRHLAQIKGMSLSLILCVS